MAKVIVEDTNLKRIADAIRSKNGETEEYKLAEFSEKIEEMNIATPVTKGFMINGWGENGYPTDVSVVGMTSIPAGYFYEAMYTYNAGSGKILYNWLYYVGSNLHLPSDLTSIGFSAFSRCTSLVLTELPDSITTIDKQAFNYCTNLALTKLPNNLKTIGDEAFMGCKNLTISSLPSTLTSLGRAAFRDCTNITVSEIPATLGINAEIFRGCTSITKMRIKGERNLTEGYYFYGCTNLEEVIFENKVTNMAGGSLEGCTKLTKLILMSDEICHLSQTSALNNTPIKNGTGYIYVPDDLVESYKTSSSWKTFAAQIKPISELGV